ncbi:MAG TPA: pirin family protein [Frankiaceae bacterium]|nr:pirin family protein [Frankiaceae bacterium]
MSGPVTTADTSDAPTPDVPEPHPTLELSESRTATVGRMTVRRALPRRTRRTVGAWCFADHMGPAAATENEGLDIGPHPHIGLQTVTWLLDGKILHRDSLGSEQLIAPGQLNLMTSGAGIAHAEQTSGTYVGQLHGIQLWVALPEATRHGGNDFEHHRDLPQVDLDRAVATVLIGEFAGSTSPARADTPLVGLELALHGGTTTLPLRPDFEYALVVLQGSVLVDGKAVGPGTLAYLGEGRDELAVTADESTRAMLLGGEPFESPIVMWWNFVGRSREEIAIAYKDWDAGTDRFGRVASPLPRIPVEAPAWLVHG